MARGLERQGAGEILLTSIDREGTWSGYDIPLVHDIADALTIPVIASGGAGTLDDIQHVLFAGAQAAAVGSMVVFQKRGMGVLVNFPSPHQIAAVLPRATP